MTKVLFICTGNICRSPTAQGVFRDLVRQAGLADAITSDSAALLGLHTGDPPDPRSVAAARARGYLIDDLRARAIARGDYRRFDLLIAMDRGHQRQLLHQAPADTRDRIHLFLDYAPGFTGTEVPDPYYGDAAGFERVLDLCEAGARGLLAALRTAPADQASQ